jgi:hypothetical protein
MACASRRLRYRPSPVPTWPLRERLPSRRPNRWNSRSRPAMDTPGPASRTRMATGPARASAASGSTGTAATPIGAPAGEYLAALVEALNALMLGDHRETYGADIDPATYYEYQWAGQVHHYLPTVSFYDIPYTFGWLFGVGLFALYQRDPETFRAGYDNLLASTGLADPATLAERIGIDICAAAFWQHGLDIVRTDVDEFERLVGRAIGEIPA